MKADAKTWKVPRIVFWVTAPLSAPLRFFSGCVFVNLASKRKPHPLALEKFGIRVVAAEDYGSQDNQNEVYAALELLNRFDQEKLELVKKHIRIIFLFPIKKDTGYEATGHICLINLQNLPLEYAAEGVPIAIAGFLVYFASLAELTGRFGLHFGRASVEFTKISKEEKRRTTQK